MTSVLFESHRLYYLPNFFPIIKEMKNRVGYEIYASIPLTMPLEEREIFFDVCKENNISTITAINETARVEMLRRGNSKLSLLVTLVKLSR